jgi:hypothetical protein
MRATRKTLAIVSSGIALVVVIGVVLFLVGRPDHHTAATRKSPNTTLSTSPNTSVITTSNARCSAPDPSNPTFASVSGNHLIDTQGRVMVPYGITVFGLADKDWQTTSSSQDDAQIKAAITKWCTNFVRLQIAPANLLSFQPYNTAFLRAVESEVNLALSYDQNVILTAQTERYTTEPESSPTQQTIQFWQVLAPIYSHNPRIWFDLFNEPRLSSGNQINTMWDDWQNGVNYDGQHYVGMQRLANAVRQAAGDTNLILIEGPGGGTTLANLSSHLIQGVNIAYAVHPYNETKEKQWNYHFGNAANTVPVVADEWSEYADTGRGECKDNAATFVPQFFSYLRQKQIGLGAWGMIPGVLVTNTTSFTPTQITPTYSCNVASTQVATMATDRNDNGGAAVVQAQGVGQLLQNYFIEYAKH